MNTRGKGWAPPKGRLREMQGLVQGSTAAGQGRGGTGTKCDFPGLGLSLAAPPSPSSDGWGELYVQVGVCLARPPSAPPPLSLSIYIYDEGEECDTHSEPQKQSDYVVISDRSLFLRELSG